MKFTKKEAVEKLTANLTNGGKKPLRMSARSLEEQTEDLMSLLDDDEMELDAFVEKVQKQFERFNSNVGHDVSEAIKALEKKTEPNEGDGKGGGSGTESTMEEKLLKRIEALEKEREDTLARNVAETKRKELKAHLLEKKVNETWLDNILDLLSLDKDSDVETLGTSLLERYNKMKASQGGEYERTPGYPSGSGEEKDNFSDVAELKKVRQPNQHV